MWLPRIEIVDGAVDETLRRNRLAERLAMIVAAHGATRLRSEGRDPPRTDLTRSGSPALANCFTPATFREGP